MNIQDKSGFYFLDLINIEECINKTCDYLNCIDKQQLIDIIVPEGLIRVITNSIKSKSCHKRFRIVSKPRYIRGSCAKVVIVFAQYGGKIEDLDGLYCYSNIKSIYFLRCF